MQLYMIHNGETYTFDENQIIIDNYNETLDSMSVHISHSEKINLKPFDKVLVVDEDYSLFFQNKFYDVDSWIETQDTLGSNENSTYSYEISLFSPTKEMEGIILPNLSITPNSKNRSVFYYIRQYNNLYGAKNRITGGFTNKWGLDPKIQQRFNSIKCPELQWNAPTFREVLNDLMMIDDCIPVLENNTISFIDLTEVKNEIKLENINYIQRSMSSNDFVSDLQIDMQNVLQTSVDGVKDTVITTEYIPFTSNDFSIGSDKWLVKTKFPILKIRHLWMIIFDSGSSGADANLAMRDLMDIDGYSLVKEAKEYQTLETLMSVLGVNYTRGEVASQYKNFCVYYTRGSNEINGFTDIDGKWNLLGLNVGEETFIYLRNIIRKNVYSDSEKWYSCLFNIEYETSVNQTLRAGKEDYPEHNRIIVDNQTNSWIDSYSQGRLEYQKANRLGNEIVMMNQKIIPVKQNYTYRGKWKVKDDAVFNVGFNKTFEFISNGRAFHSMSCVLNQGDWILYYDAIPVYYNGSWVSENYKIIDLGDEWQDSLALQTYYEPYNKPIKIGDYYNDLICYQTQYQVYRDHIEVNAFLTKNYILRDYFTGVNSKIRTWKNAVDEAFERQDIVKKYCLLDFLPHTEQSNFEHLANKMLSPLKAFTSQPLKYVLGRTIDSDVVSYPSNSDWCVLPLVVRPIGNSIVLTTGMDDNTTFGKNIPISQNDIEFHNQPPKLYIKTSGLTPAGGIPLKNIKYVDDNYEFEDLVLRFVSDLDIGQEKTVNQTTINIPHVEDQSISYSTPEILWAKLFRLPIVDDYVYNDVLIYENKTFYKDNKEIPKISYQYEFCTKDRNIYFTRKWVENQSLIKTNNNTAPKVYVSNTWKYGSEILPSDATLINANINITDENLNVSKATISFTNQDVNYLYATDSDDNILLGLKINDTLSSVDLYLSIVLDRDLSIYDNNGEKIGEI